MEEPVEEEDSAQLGMGVMGLVWCDIITWEDMIKLTSTTYVHTPKMLRHKVAAIQSQTGQPNTQKRYTPRVGRRGGESTGHVVMADPRPVGSSTKGRESSSGCRGGDNTTLCLGTCSRSLSTGEQ